MATSGIDRVPVKVTQFSKLVLVEFSNEEGARALKRDLDGAILAQGNHAEFRRRYAVSHGIDEAVPIGPE